MSRILNLKDISKSYKDGDEQALILDNLNLQVDKGQLVAIVGPSGSGKSTLLSIAGLLLTADSGEIYLDDQLVKGGAKELTYLRREKLGFIFQNHHLLPYMTVEDQIKEVAKFNKNRKTDEIEASVGRLLEELGLEGCKSKYPHQMSGGQRQRSAIARAFIHKPKLILADEPTASLDEDRGRQIAELIQMEVKRNDTGAIMVTHDERILDVVDKVFQLRHGKLIDVSEKYSALR